MPLILEVEELIAARGCRLQTIDGLEDIRDADNAMRELRAPARKLDIAVVVTTTGRLGRTAAYAGRLPVLDDLRDHEAFGADVVVPVHRNDAFDAETERAGEADLVAAKHRAAQ